MRGLMIVVAGAWGLAACAPYEALPTSPAQWERRQNQIEHREQERQRECALLDQNSERFKQRCDAPRATP